MKKYKLGLWIMVAMFLFTACKKTSILDNPPQDKYSDAVLWSDVGLADAYLLDTYHGAKLGFTQTLLSSVSDETHEPFGHGPEVYVAGNLTPDNVTPWDGSEYNFPTWGSYFSNIQKLNVFIAKIDGVVDAYPESEKAAVKAKTDKMKGEAVFLRAYCYSQLVRTYGGVPIMKTYAKLGDDFSAILRGSFEETIAFIAEDCEVASTLLPGRDEAVMGRASKGAALALKSRVLLFAASDLTADGSVQNKFVAYINPNRPALWKAAKDAAKAVIDLGEYQLADFGAPDQAAVSKNYNDFFKSKDFSNREIIWGKMYSKSVGDKNLMNAWNGGNGWAQWASNAPLQNLVDSYQMADGSDFADHFNINGQGFYTNISGKYLDQNIYSNRDPRFYGSILFDNAPWRKRNPELQGRDPLGVYDRKTKITINGGIVTSTVYGIDSRQGPMSPWNGSFTGYVLKKLVDNDIDYMLQDNENAWIEMRYAEVLLNYAEACLGLNEGIEAEEYINKIRNRAGLPDFTGNATTALRYERKIELVFENSRWYDIRRWKILPAALSNAMGVDITETNNDGVLSTTWKQISVEERTALPKMYWIPIPRMKLKKPLNWIKIRIIKR